MIVSNPHKSEGIHMQKLILAGAGHAHLHIIKNLITNPLSDVEVVLISPSDYQYYSGMFSGYTEGIYELDEIRVSLEELSEQANLSWYKQAVVSVDPEQKILLTDQGEVLSYDALSFDIGSLTAHTDLKGVKEYARRIKPNYHFPEMIQQMRESKNPIIVGGGIAGTEIALSLQCWRSKHGYDTPVTLLSGSPRLLENYPETTSKKITDIVENSGIDLYVNEKVQEMNSTKVITDDNKFNYKDVMWLAGPRAPELFRLSNLPIDDEGYLQVESTLQVEKYPSIFGAGDCVTLSHAPDTPKNGVFAIREAPVLWENIKGFLSTGEGQHYKPQSKYLAIMSIGNKEGFLLYGSIALKGKLAWLLKHRIDKKFMDTYKSIEKSN